MDRGKPHTPSTCDFTNNVNTVACFISTPPHAPNTLRQKYEIKIIITHALRLPTKCGLRAFKLYSVFAHSGNNQAHHHVRQTFTQHLYTTM